MPIRSATMQNTKVQLICKVAMLSAIAAILMLLQFAIPFVPPFYQMDFSEVIVLLCGFALGPIAVIICEALKIVLNLLMNGTDTLGVGELANFIMGCSFVLPATIFYHRHKSKKYAKVGLVLGTLCLCVVSVILNYLVLLPAYSYFLDLPLNTLISMGTSVNGNIDSLFSFILLAVLPFNLLKGILTSVGVLLIYKKISPLLKRKY